MFIISSIQYEELVKKATYISKDLAYDIVHDSILKYHSFEECLNKMFYEKIKYTSVNEMDLTKIYETKICIKCNIPSPVACFEVYRYKNIVSTKNVCEECRFNDAKKYNELNKEIKNEKTRLRWVSDIDFRKKRINDHKNWAVKNKDQVNKYQNEYRKKHREKTVEYMKQWRAKNKEILKEKRKKYIIENKEKIDKKYNEWRNKNRDILNEKNRVRYKNNASKNSL